MNPGGKEAGRQRGREESTAQKNAAGSMSAGQPQKALRKLMTANYAAARYCQILPVDFTWNTPPSSAWRK
jgi:hypothetical protein